MTAPTGGGGLGSAFVRIRADASRFAREARRSINNGLADIEDYLTRGRFPNAVRRAGAQAGRDFARMFNTFANNININIDRQKLVGFLASFGKVTAAIGGAATALNTIVPAVVALGAALATVGATAASVIPFLIAGFIAVSQTLKLAFKGVSEAIKAIAEDDLEALNEALKKLSPSARVFVKEIAAARPQFKRLQQDIQEGFFRPLRGGFTELIRSGILNTLRKNMVGIAVEAGETARQVFRLLSGNAVRPQLQIILESTRKIFGNLLDAVPNLIRMFLSLAAAAGPLVATLTGGFGPAMEQLFRRVQTFADSGGLNRLFQGTGEIVQSVIAVVSDLGAILGSVLGALLGGGDGGAGPIGSLLQTIREFVESPEGSAALEQLGKIFQEIGTIVGGVLRPVLPVIAKLINTLSGPLLSIVERLSRPLIRLAEDIAVLIGRFLEAGGPILDKLIDVLVEFAVQALGLLAKHIEEMGPLFTEFMKQLGPELLPLVQALGDVLLALLPLLPAITEALVEIIPALIDLMPLFVFMVQVTTLLWQGIAVLVGWIASLLGWIVKLVGSALGAYLKFIQFMLEEVWPRVFEGIKVVLTAWFDWWIGMWGKAFDAAKGAVQRIADFVTVLRNIVAEKIMQIGELIAGIPGMIGRFIGSIASAAARIGRAIGEGIANIPGAAADIAGRIVGRIKGFLNNVIQSINNGIFRIASFLHFGLPYLPYLAKGAIVDGPTLAVIGERGPEVVLPLNDPDRARELAHQAGLASLLGEGFGGEAAPPNVQVFIGDEEITRRIDVRIQRWTRGQARELAYGARGV